MAAVPELELGCEFYMSRYYAEADLARELFPSAHGKVQVPSAPGIGVVPDPDVLSRYCLESLDGSGS